MGCSEACVCHRPLYVLLQHDFIRFLAPDLGLFFRLWRVVLGLYAFMHAAFAIEHNLSVGTMFVVQVPQARMRLDQMEPMSLPARFNMESLHLLYI